LANIRDSGEHSAKAIEVNQLDRQTHKTMIHKQRQNEKNIDKHGSNET